MPLRILLQGEPVHPRFDLKPDQVEDVMAYLLAGGYASAGSSVATIRSARWRWADMIGLDVLLSVMQVLHDEFADSKYRACPLLKELVAVGHLGRKSDRAVFSY